jgi:hypothetical protein
MPVWGHVRTAQKRVPLRRARQIRKPKTINEEVRVPLRIPGEPGEIIYARLRRKKMLKLKVRNAICNAFSEKEKERGA